MITEIVSGTVAGVLASLIIHGIHSTRFGGLKRVKVFEPRSGIFNEEFYAYFQKQIESADSEIIVTGEGFEYRGQKGPIIADLYHTSMKKALSKNVDITRIQSARPLHRKWAEKLKECIREYPNNFHLYILENKEYQDVASVCVIDPDSKNNVVEFMLSVENDIEDSSVRLASAGMFLHGRRDLAKAMKENTLAMKHFSIAKKCVTESDIDEFIK